MFGRVGVVSMVEQARKGTVKAPRADSTEAATTRDGTGETAHAREADTPPDVLEGVCGDKVATGKRIASGGRKRGIVAPKPDVNCDVRLGFLSDCVGFHLRLAQDASYRTFAKHRDKDLIKPGRYPALAIIHLNPGISQSALGRAIARDKSTVSPLIKDLQKNGFINRKASTQDRRSVTLALTKKGERTLDKLHARATEHEGELDRLVGPSKARLMSLLGKIITSMSP